MRSPKSDIHQNFPSFSKHFSKLPDPRRTNRGHFLYPLEEILFLTISAVVSDAKSWEQIRVFAEDKLDWLSKFYPYKNGIPSADVLERLFARLDSELFNTCFMEWVHELTGLLGEELIAFDGKTARGSADKGSTAPALHMVSAFATAQKVTLGQVAVNEKSNEITAIPKLLDLLTIKGCFVSIDAMGCQKQIAKKICKKQADYILQVKGNQQALLEEVENVFEITKIDSTDHSRDFGHGRIEQRTCKVINDLSFLDERVKWEGLKSIVRVERKTVEKQSLKESNHISYFISSASLPAHQFNELIRGHWAIENNLHWSLDVLFKEDASLKKKGNSARNFNMITKIALLMIEKQTFPKTSRVGKMKKCAYNDNYREKTMNI